MNKILVLGSLKKTSFNSSVTLDCFLINFIQNITIYNRLFPTFWAAKDVSFSIIIHELMNNGILNLKIYNQLNMSMVHIIDLESLELQQATGTRPVQRNVVYRMKKGLFFNIPWWFCIGFLYGLSQLLSLITEEPQCNILHYVFKNVSSLKWYWPRFFTNPIWEIRPHLRKPLFGYGVLCVRPCFSANATVMGYCTISDYNKQNSVIMFWPLNKS